MPESLASVYLRLLDAYYVECGIARCLVQKGIVERPFRACD